MFLVQSLQKEIGNKQKFKHLIFNILRAQIKKWIRAVKKNQQNEGETFSKYRNSNWILYSARGTKDRTTQKGYNWNWQVKRF